jgi:hypothetical protein
MGTALTGTTQSSTYNALLKTTANTNIDGTLRAISDGIGTDSALQVSTAGVASTGFTKLASTVVGGLPAASTAGAGALYYVTDLASGTIGATAAGSGSIKGTVVSDGTNWKVQGTTAGFTAIRTATDTTSPGTLTAGTGFTDVVTVSGAVLGDFALVTRTDGAAWPPEGEVYARVNAAGFVTVTFYCPAAVASVAFGSSIPLKVLVISP